MSYTPSLGSKEPYSSVLGIHFTTRVAPTTVRREHNNEAPKFRIDTDGETENTTTLSPARKEWLWYHKGGRDTALEVEAQLYSEGGRDTALEVEAQLYSDNITWK